MEQRITSVDITLEEGHGFSQADLHKLTLIARRCVANDYATQYGGGVPEHYHAYAAEHLPDVLAGILQNPEPYLANQDDVVGWYTDSETNDPAYS